jgi:hypothetical protein
MNFLAGHSPEGKILNPSSDLTVNYPILPHCMTNQPHPLTVPAGLHAFQQSTSSILVLNLQHATTKAAPCEVPHQQKHCHMQVQTQRCTLSCSPPICSRAAVSSSSHCSSSRRNSDTSSCKSSCEASSSGTGHKRSASAVASGHSSCTMLLVALNVMIQEVEGCRAGDEETRGWRILCGPTGEGV